MIANTKYRCVTKLRSKKLGGDELVNFSVFLKYLYTFTSYPRGKSLPMFARPRISKTDDAIV